MMPRCRTHAHRHINTYLMLSAELRDEFIKRAEWVNKQNQVSIDGLPAFPTDYQPDRPLTGYDVYGEVLGLWWQSLTDGRCCLMRPRRGCMYVLLRGLGPSAADAWIPWFRSDQEAWRQGLEQ